MCFASSAPTTPSPSPPRQQNTQPLNSPYPDEDQPGSLSQLRLSGTNAALSRRRGSGPTSTTQGPDMIGPPSPSGGSGLIGPPSPISSAPASEGRKVPPGRSSGLPRPAQQ